MAAIDIVLSRHAVDRFHDRVRPSLSRDAAERELGRLVAFGDVVSEAPEWHARGAARRAPWYVVIADVVLPLQPASTAGVYVATTCLARCAISDASRARRNRGRSRRKNIGREHGRVQRTRYAFERA